MDWFTIIGVIASTITVGGFLTYIIRKLFRFYRNLETKLSQIENKIRIHPLYTTNRLIVVEDFNGNITDIEQGTTVRIKSVTSGYAYFETKDSLLYGKAPVDSFDECIKRHYEDF